jgi:hypothetical protein
MTKNDIAQVALSRLSPNPSCYRPAASRESGRPALHEEEVMHETAESRAYLTDPGDCSPLQRRERRDFRPFPDHCAEGEGHAPRRRRGGSASNPPDPPRWNGCRLDRSRRSSLRPARRLMLFGRRTRCLRHKALLPSHALDSMPTRGSISWGRTAVKDTTSPRRSGQSYGLARFPGAGQTYCRWSESRRT